MKHRSISGCCKSRVEFLEGGDITKCRDLAQQSKSYHEKHKTVVFRCKECGISCRVIAGMVA